MREGEQRTTRLLALCEEEIATGFRLAGVEARALHDRNEVEATLSRELEAGDYGLILIDSALLEDVDEVLKQKVLESDFPFVLAFPLGLTEITGEKLDAQLADLVRRMTGFNLLAT